VVGKKQGLPAVLVLKSTIRAGVTFLTLEPGRKQHSEVKNSRVKNRQIDRPGSIPGKVHSNLLNCILRAGSFPDISYDGRK
jgi:hypothetical protein